MKDDTGPISPTDVADGLLDATEAEAFLKENPSRAAEVEIARRVRALMHELKAASIEMPVDFEARLMARVREDETLLNLLEVALYGFGRAVVELINALLSFSQAEPQPAEG